jgi:hypothetical protein
LNGTGFYSSVPTGVPVARAVGGALAGQSPEDWEHTWNHRGPGGMVSTVRDLYLWTLALDAGRVLSARSLAQQRTPHTRNGYGYGIQIEQAAGRHRLRHSGLWYAFTSDYRHFPDDSVTIVVLSNEALDDLHTASVVAAALEAAVFGLEREPPPALTTGNRLRMERLVGRYVVSDGAEIAIAAEADHLVVVGTGQLALSALTDPTPAPDPNQVTAVNRATLEILGGVDRGDFATLMATAPPERAERYRRVLPGIWRQRQDSLGSIAGIDLIGTIAPAGSDQTWETHARIRYVRGEERVALYWTPSGRLAGLENGDPSIPAALTTFRPTVDGFAAHHLGTGTTIRLEPTPDGVAIARPGGERIRAVRVP